MSYIVQVDYNCGLGSAFRQYSTFPAAFKIAQMFRDNPNVDCYIEENGKRVYEGLAYHEYFDVRHDSADFDEIISFVEDKSRLYIR